MIRTRSMQCTVRCFVDDLRCINDTIDIKYFMIVARLSNVNAKINVKSAQCASSSSSNSKALGTIVLW